MGYRSREAGGVGGVGVPGGSIVRRATTEAKVAGSRPGTYQLSGEKCDSVFFAKFDANRRA